MSDDKTTTGIPGNNSINTNEDYEVKYWSTKFAVSAQGLINAVKTVGNDAMKVESYLRKNNCFCNTISFYKIYPHGLFRSLVFGIHNTKRQTRNF